MKKLGRLSINPDRLMKDEELVSLKGGYPGQICCTASGTTQGTVSYCGDPDIMESWYNFWSYNYSVECNHYYFV